MKKQILSLVLALILAAGIIVMPSCKNEEEPPMETVTVYGRFFSVREAYENEFITLEQIHYINDNIRKPEVFTPMTDERKEKILHDFNATHALKSGKYEIDDYGTYGDITFLRITDLYYKNNRSDETCLRGEGATKYYYNLPLSFWDIMVWREYEGQTEVEKPRMPNGAFFSLQNAYGFGYLTDEDLDKWHNLKFDTDWNELPQDWEEISKKIKQDYFLFDIDTFGFIDIYYCIGFSQCILIEIPNLGFSDVLESGRNDKLIQLGDYKYLLRLPFVIAWVPLDKLKEEI